VVLSQSESFQSMAPCIRRNGDMAGYEVIDFCAAEEELKVGSK
jgi:hypothetical protein